MTGSASSRSAERMRETSSAIGGKSSIVDRPFARMFEVSRRRAA
jgi:hypothetical protein